MNTVAVLFILHIDNYAYSHGLAEKTRSLLEDRARLALGEDVDAALQKSKLFHLAFVPASLAGALVGFAHGYESPAGFIIFCLPLLGGSVETGVFVAIIAHKSFASWALG